ncbi:hypothetical protein PENTCL1PPCAC_18170, partial [Pristionchus entomophagus]
RKMLKSFSAITLATRGASLSTGKPIIAVPKIGSFSLYLKESAAKYTNLNKESFGAFGKETAAKWKGLSDNEKQSYAKRAQEINDKAIAAFLKKPESEQKKLEAEAREAKEKLAKKREKRERRENWEKTGHPKRPLSAYMLFMKEKLSQGAKVANKEEAAARVKAMAEEWRGLSDSAKAKYVKVADADAAEYKIDVAKWENAIAAKEKSVSPMKSFPSKKTAM